MTEPTAPGTLPISTILSEASPESVSEVTTLDPETWSPGQLERMVEMLRAGAARRAAGLVEDAGRKRAPGAAKPPKTTMTIDDLGI